MVLYLPANCRIFVIRKIYKMSLRLFSFLIACVFSLALQAQSKMLIIEGTAPNVYLTHTVAPKENYYSIGRMYNVSPKDQIAPFNKLEMEKGLSPGQSIKIPLVAGNFVQDGAAAAADEVLIPVYHTVAEKEGLYRVSVNYNKVPIETLKQWNKLKADAVSNGTKLIVGYLKVKTALSPLAAMGTTIPVEDGQAKDGIPKVIKPVKETPKETKEVPVVKAPEKEKPIAKVPEKEKPVVTEPEKKTQPKTEEVKTVVADAGRFNGGIFKNLYEEKGDMQRENGSANIFKSTSGWNDGKYYCLHNGAQPGTIIKITSNTTGKSIYAKVLDVMPDIKQNTGILIRISNAAAQDLGVGDSKFDCSLSYSK